MKPKRILYVQHASGLGGSALSLLYTIQQLDTSRYEPVVALIRPSRELITLYSDAGIRVIEWPGIETFEHTTLDSWSPLRPHDWVTASRFATGFRRSLERTDALVREVRPDLVHLNSAVLAPSAYALRQSDIPLVWHVREPPAPGLTGVRRRLISGGMMEWPDELVFISRDDQLAWVGGKRGQVVHNFVDLERFRPTGRTDETRRTYGIGTGDPVVLFAGGRIMVKGIAPLLEAVKLLIPPFPTLRILLPGMIAPPSEALIPRLARAVLPLVGSGTPRQKVDRELARPEHQANLIPLPFVRDIAPLMEVSTVVVFPALLAHFPRPAVEAAAMGRPVVASDLPGISEIVQQNVTGLLVPPNDPEALADAIATIIDSPGLAHNMGEAAAKVAHSQFSAPSQVRLITQIYEKLCH